METDGAEEVERCNSEPMLHSHRNDIEEAEDAEQQPAVSTTEEKPSTLMNPVLAKSDALQDRRGRCRSVAPDIAAEAKADHLGLAKKRKAELEVELELLQAEKEFFDESSKRLQQQLQQLMQVYVSVKRDHSFLNSKFQGSAKEREAREQRLQDHRDWVAMQTREDIERRICRAQAMVRGHYARKQYARLVKRNKHRNHLLNEVLGTEKTYCESLKRVIKMYKVPLRYACNSSSPIVTETEIDRMFGNMEEIWEFHKGWLRHYEERLEQWHNHQKAGDLFCALSESLPLYSVYSRTHTISVRMVERLNKRNGAFIEFASARKDIVMNLASLLILPIQRIPRYSLLLKDIIKDTPEEHPDYEDLCRGLEEVERLAKGMNRAAKMTNNTRKILDIENMFNGDLFLLKPEDARKYVQSADVEVIIGKKLHEDARLWLFSDVVVLGQLKDEFVEGEPEYNLLVRVDLININVEPVNDAKDSISFSIKTIKNKNANDEVSVVVVCARDDERRMWLELITKSKGKLIDQLLSIA